jgi:hypothetical protein
MGRERDKIRRLILFDLPRYKSYFVLKLDRSLDDAGMYVDHTGTSVKTLLVTNYAELEEVIGKVRHTSTQYLVLRILKELFPIKLNLECSFFNRLR